MSRVAPAILDSPGSDRFGKALIALVHEGLSERDRLRLPLRGDSMWPTVPAGSLVDVERVDLDDIRLGDIIVWQRAGRLVAHRVVQRSRDGANILLVTKGDNVSSSDQALRPDLV